MSVDTLPKAIETERIVLGGILVSDDAMHGVRTVLEPDDFSLAENRKTWAAMCAVYDAGGAVDRITVMRYLLDNKQLGADDISSINALEEGMPQIFHLESYIKILKDKSALRRFIAGADNLQKQCASGRPVQEIIDWAGGFFSGLSAGTGSNGPVSVAELIERDGINNLLAPRRDQGIRFPWKEIDDLTCGLHPEQLVLVSAQTSQGKTSFALQIASHAARQKVGVLIFSLEMSVASLFRRMVNQLARLDWDRARHGALAADELQRQREAVAWLRAAPIYFDEGAQTVPGIHAAIRKVKAQHPIGLVIVDYLQLLTGVGRPENRAKEVGGNSRALKLAAKEFHIPFVVLSQLNRNSAKDGREPELWDLKESGDIENDADSVIFIHALTCDENPIKPVKITIAKQREGPRNRYVPMQFDSACQSFDSKADSSYGE